MARVSICDYCKSISKEDLHHFLNLDCDDGACEAGTHLDNTPFEVCKDCFESLLAHLGGEAVPEIPKAIITHGDIGDGGSVSTVPVVSDQQVLRAAGLIPDEPTDTLLDHELTVVPTRRDEVVPEKNNVCKHKYDIVNDPIKGMYLQCLRCEDQMASTSHD